MQNNIFVIVCMVLTPNVCVCVCVCVCLRRSNTCWQSLLIVRNERATLLFLFSEVTRTQDLVTAAAVVTSQADTYHERRVDYFSAAAITFIYNTLSLWVQEHRTLLVRQSVLIDSGSEPHSLHLMILGSIVARELLMQI